MRVVIVDSFGLVRKALRLLLEHFQLEVLGDFEPGPDVLAFAAQAAPEVLIVELVGQGKAGLMFLKSWKAHNPRIPVLVLSSQTEQPWLDWAVEGKVEGYLSKHCDPEELLNVLAVLVQGEKSYCEQVREHFENPADFLDIPRLTPRELQVLRLVSLGADLDQLATEMIVSRNTAKTHLHALYRKLRVSDRARLLVRSRALGFLE